MNFLTDFLYVLLFAFFWVLVFLFHELMHIIGTLTLHGTITVDGLSMNASPANLLAGGILAGIIFNIAGAIIWFLESPAIGYMLIICGMVNIAYAPFEYVFLPKWGNTRKYKLRYGIYIGVTLIMLLIWMSIGG